MAGLLKQIRLLRINTDLQILRFARWSPSIVILVIFLLIPFVAIVSLGLLNLLVFFEDHPILGDWLRQSTDWFRLQIRVTCIGLLVIIFWFALKLLGWFSLAVRLLFGFTGSADRRITNLLEKRERLAHG